LSVKLEKLFEDMSDLRNWSDGMRTLARIDAAESIAKAIIALMQDEGGQA